MLSLDFFKIFSLVVCSFNVSLASWTYGFISDLNFRKFLDVTFPSISLPYSVFNSPRVPIACLLHFFIITSYFLDTVFFLLLQTKYITGVSLKSHWVINNWSRLSWQHITDCLPEWCHSSLQVPVDLARFHKQNFQHQSVQFSRSVVSDSLQPHESQLARPPCPSPTPGVHSDSRPLSQWCHPAISSSVISFSSWPKSLPASESFPMSQPFIWGGPSTGV